MRAISGRFRAASMNRLRLLGQILRRAAAAILQLHGEAGARAETRNRRRPEGHDARFRNLLRERAGSRPATTPFACSSSVLRSSHGLSCTKKKPMFDE